MDIPSLSSYCKWGFLRSEVSPALRIGVDKQVLLGFMLENREERKREQKFKMLNLGEEVILIRGWNVKKDIKEQKQLLCMNHWGRQRDFGRSLCPSSWIRKEKNNLSYSEIIFGCCTVCFSKQ